MAGEQFRLQDHVRLRSGGPRMSVAGHRSAQGRREEFMCTWTDAEGQAWSEWFGEASLERCPPLGRLLHVACGTEATVAQLSHDVALYVWCERCEDIVEAGALSEARRPGVPVDPAGAVLRVSRGRVAVDLAEGRPAPSALDRAQEVIAAWQAVIAHTAKMPADREPMGTWLDERGPLLERATRLTRLYAPAAGASGG
jgi:uncharacterized protein YodC (DUF2158 family)